MALSMEGLLDKMSRVYAFNVVTTQHGKKDCYLTPGRGTIDFFVDAEDARQALRAAQAKSMNAIYCLWKAITMKTCLPSSRAKGPPTQISPGLFHSSATWRQPISLAV